jgi:hypothetical protein
MQEKLPESLLRSGNDQAKAGQTSTARRYLEALYASDNNNHELMAEAWFWMARPRMTG